MSEREDWLISNLSLNSQRFKSWHLTFGVVLDRIWRARNDFIFHNVSLHPLGIVRDVKKTVEDIEVALSELSTMRIRRDLATGSALIRWIPPSFVVLRLTVMELLTRINRVLRVGAF